MKRAIAFFLILFAACNQSKKDNEFAFIVSSFNKPTNPKEPPPPPMPEYAPFNFIIDSNGQVYYYQLQLGKPKCASGNDDDLTPPFIELKPENMVQVSNATLEDFVSSNILFLDKGYKYVSIACLVDTVKSNSLKKLIDICTDTAHKITYSIRRETQEEKIVLDHKKRQLYYDPNSVLWDSSRIRFMPKMIKSPEIDDE